ncbi:terminase TerL endonuclease subunit [Marinovum sp. B10]|uniref:terminase TerL endonuclease subunit n=1 Tax=Marinovum sp. B10 TaxID=3449224 RepID=UPI003EDC2E57
MPRHIRRSWRSAGISKTSGCCPTKTGSGWTPKGVASIVDALIEAEFDIEDIRAISQGYKLNAAIKGTPVKLKNRTLQHCDQRIMRWSVGNAKTETRGNAVLVTKAKSGSAKIDPLMALFNAVMLMSWNPVAGGAKAFEYTGM